MVLVGWLKRTEVHLIALEAVTELGAVDLENSSVLRETMFIDAESDGWGAEDIAEDAVVEFFPVLIDLIEQHSKCLHHLPRLVQQPLSLNPGHLSLLNVDSVGAVLPLLEPFQRLTVMPCRPIPSLIELTRSVKPLLPSRSTSLVGLPGWRT